MNVAQPLSIGFGLFFLETSAPGFAKITCRILIKFQKQTFFHSLEDPFALGAIQPGIVGLGLQFRVEEKSTLRKQMDRALRGNECGAFEGGTQVKNGLVSE